MSTISVVGSGYVGLVTGACFADLGNDVTCIDVDERNVRAGRLRFTTSYKDGLAGAEFVFVAVNTPPGLAGEADMTYARSAAHSMGVAL